METESNASTFYENIHTICNRTYYFSHNQNFYSPDWIYKVFFRQEMA